jgi:hypothetical protein
MFPALLIFLGLGVLVSTIVSWFTEMGCRLEIEQAEPAFARKLFRSSGDQVIFGSGPVRVWALFFDTAPASISSSIQLLRWVCGTQLFMLFALGCCVIGMALSDVISH